MSRKEKKTPWNKGLKIDRNKYPNFGHFKKHTEETKEKIRKKKKEQHIIPKTAFKKGQIAWNKGKKSPWTSERNRLTNSERLSGDKHWNWQGGKSFEPYSCKFNNKLKRKIKERDGYTCQKCGSKIKEILMVHHIDYDKKNSDEDNLITLCWKCNSVVNFDRIYWIGYFQNIIRISKKTIK